MKNYYSTKTMSRLFCICVLKTHWDFTEKNCFLLYFLNFWLWVDFLFYIKYYTHENTQVLKVKNSFWKRKFAINTKILNFFLEEKKSLKLFFREIPEIINNKYNNKMRHVAMPSSVFWKRNKNNSNPSPQLSLLLYSFPLY